MNEQPMNAAFAKALLFESAEKSHLFLANGSRVFEVSRELADTLSDQQAKGDVSALDKTLKVYGLDAPEQISSNTPASIETRAISLAVAQTCNLGCSYCYAKGGDFGGGKAKLPFATAKVSIDSLIDQTPSHERVNIAFMGGEPLANREVIREATEYAVKKAAIKNIQTGFSITTNGTLLTQEDGDFFERYGFAVTISLDGLAQVHDAQRPFKNGRGSFDLIMERVKPLLAQQKHMQISARVTVTPRNLDLMATLEGLIDLGFHSVGFSPMLSSPTGKDEMDIHSLQHMLSQMIACAHQFEKKIIKGQRFPFSNAVSAMKEIHRGSHKPYPCGAGAGYVGVSAKGGLYACHRFVGDESANLGNVWSGLSQSRQAQWLTERHVHFQEPCNHCWARYLCGGGCHYEVIHKGRNNCDFIRGWLTECLKIYTRLLEKQPEYFTGYQKNLRSTAE